MSTVLKFVLCLACILFSKLSLAFDLPHDGFLRLFHSHSEEFLEITYEKNGKIDPIALKKINHFMRSREDGKEIEINPDLIRLLDHLQDHFGVDEVEIICGYRSPQFNNHLKSQGRNVAEESFHMKGMATDIHLDEIPENKLRDYLLQLGLGGVGYYPDQLFVHADFGPVRTWQDGRFTDRKNIGIFNKENSSSVTTNHLFYSSVNQVVLKKKNIPTTATWTLEWFHRGQWQTADDKTQWGKFRWRVTWGEEWQNSNEFYVKKNLP